MTQKIKKMRVFPQDVRTHKKTGEKALIFNNEKGQQIAFTPVAKDVPLSPRFGTGFLEHDEGNFAFTVTSDPGEAHRLATQEGPAQVATVEYRQGWERIFEDSKEVN